MVSKDSTFLLSFFYTYCKSQVNPDLMLHCAIDRCYHLGYQGNSAGWIHINIQIKTHKRTPHVIAHVHVVPHSMIHLSHPGAIHQRTLDHQNHPIPRPPSVQDDLQSYNRLSDESWQVAFSHRSEVYSSSVTLIKLKIYMYILASTCNCIYIHSQCTFIYMFLCHCTYT